MVTEVVGELVPSEREVGITVVFDPLIVVETPVAPMLMPEVVPVPPMSKDKAVVPMSIASFGLSMKGVVTLSRVASLAHTALPLMEVRIWLVVPAEPGIE